MSINNVGGNTPSITWQSLLTKVNEASGTTQTAEVSGDNRSVTFTTSVNGKAETIQVSIPDDLALPSAVTPESIDSLIQKLGGSGFNLSEAQLEAIKGDLEKTYAQMSSAMSKSMALSSGGVMFDLYQLMALLVEVSQSQRNAARDLRNTQNQQLQNSIQAQADMQRAAALTGLIVGATCGALSTFAAIGMMAGQSAAYKTQVSTAKASGLNSAQNNVTMLKNANTPESAAAQLKSVTKSVDPKIASDVKTKISQQTATQKASFDEVKLASDKADAKFTKASKADTDAKTALEGTKADLEKTGLGLDEATAKVNGLKGKMGEGKADIVEISGGKNAETAMNEYKEACTAKGHDPDPNALKAYEGAKAAEADHAKAVTAHQKASDTAADTAKTLASATEQKAAANGALDKARTEYRSALHSAVEEFEGNYESALAKKDPPATAKEISEAKQAMTMARAYAYNEMAQPGVNSPSSYRADMLQAKATAGGIARDLESNIDYRTALRRIETLGALNGLNSSLSNTVQNVTQNITSMIGAEATRMGADQQKAQEELDQTKDLFEQAQGVVDAAIQLMNAVVMAESQSMRDAIQA